MYRKTNTMAIVSLVAGIVGWTVMPLLGSIVAIIAGHMARGQIRRSNGMEEGNGLALIGLVLGYLSLLGGLIALVLVILMFMGTIGLGFLAAIFG
jgi:hypothetical protein